MNSFFGVNRTRFLGHVVMLRCKGHGGKFVLAAQSLGAELAALFD